MRAPPAWCAALLLACASAAAYTVDCNHEYTDCENELNKQQTVEDYESSTSQTESATVTTQSTPKLPDRTTPKIIPSTTHAPELDPFLESEVEKSTKDPHKLTIDELQTFASLLHNQTTSFPKGKALDLSDISLDSDEEEKVDKDDKKLQEKLFPKMEAPFGNLMAADKSDELDGTCKEMGNVYKIGDKLDRGCEESCECAPGGSFDCSPRCKHPYVRRGRRLGDPLCFESPVDDCCSIIACATGNNDGSQKGPTDGCRHGNESYVVGQKWNIGCEQTCSCDAKNVVICKPRCAPLKTSDKCIAVADPRDACCQLQVCDVSEDAHEEPENVTSSTTSTTEQSQFRPLAPTPLPEDNEYNYEKEVESIRNNDDLQPTNDKEADRRTELYTNKPPMAQRPLVLMEPIGSVTVLQNQTVQVNLIHPNNTKDPIHLLLSNDGGKTFKDIELKYSNLILNLDGGKDYVLKTKETGTKFNFTVTASDIGVDMNELQRLKQNDSITGCLHEGIMYAIGEEYHIGCTELCECVGHNRSECAALACPSHVGLELVSRGCVQWAPGPAPRPPNCCPRAARCLSDGSCKLAGHTIPNWSEVPIALTGCEQRCFCENGELDCQDVCSPLPPLPPQTLRCPPMFRPAPVNVSDEDCCKKWGCVSNVPGAPPVLTTTGPHMPQLPVFLPTIPPEEPEYPQEDLADYDQNNVHRPVLPDHVPNPQLPPHIPPHTLPPPPKYGDDNKKLSVISLESDSPTSIKMLFGLPPVLVGLRGSVDLRYTDKPDEDVSRWYSQVFAPTDEILSTSRLEFQLNGLKPSTTYRVRGKLYLHNLPVEPESDVYSVTTRDAPRVEEKRRPVDCKLTVVEVNDTAAHVIWRHFSEDELLLIDGIQVRYRPVGTPIYLMTELLHHSRSTAELADLRPGSRYEASLVLVPPPRAVVELFDPTSVEFVTQPYIDPYNWSVTIEAASVGSTSASITWRGVPSPPERWVRVYRGAHACGGGRGREHDAFQLAARDTRTELLLSGMEPDTRCRVWLELFLTNGKVKTSNVLEIMTKPADSDSPVDNEIEQASSVGARGGPTTTRGDYYGSLVVVGVVAALGAVTSLLLLLIVVRRHRPRSVPITSVPSAPRDSSLPPYDNPAYKLELQQETMDL